MKKTIFIISLSFILSSCKKETPPLASSPSLFDLISNKNWLLTDYTVTPAIANISDLYKEMDSCQLDDIEIFQKNGFLKYDFGTIKCQPNEERYDTTTTWKLSRDSVFNKIQIDVNTVFYDTLYGLKADNNSLSYFFKRKTSSNTQIYFQKFKKKDL